MNPATLSIALAACISVACGAPQAPPPSPPAAPDDGLAARLAARYTPREGVLTWARGVDGVTRLTICGQPDAAPARDLLGEDEAAAHARLRGLVARCGCLLEGVAMAPRDARTCPDGCNTCRCGGGGSVSTTLLSCKIEILEKIFFAPNSAEIPDRARSMLGEIAAVLQREAQLALEVEGHAAEGEADPEALSVTRARVVLDALIAGGVSAERLGVVGYGAGRPISPDEPARNRRVSFRVIDTRAKRRP